MDVQIQMKQLNARRIRIFKKLNRAADFISKANQKSEKEAVRVRMEEIKKIRVDFDAIQDEIAVLNSTLDPVKDKDIILDVDSTEEKFEDLIYGCQLKFNKLCNVPESVSSARRDATNASGNANSSHDVRRIDVPKFSGKIEDWLNFKALYEVAIHNTSMSKAVKLTHLKSLLQGTAASLIEKFPIQDEQYDPAWAALTDRFENQRILASHQLNNLLGYRKIPLTSKQALEGYLAAHSSTMESVTNIGLADPKDFLLFQICYRNLDQESQSDFDKLRKPNIVPTYENLMEFMLDKLKYADMNANSSVFTVTKEANKPAPAFAGKSKPPHRSLVANQVSPKCEVCNETHKVFQCPQYLKMNVSQRQEVVTSRKLCVNCLSGAHFRSKCKSASRCTQCKGWHHTTLHRSTGGSEQSTSSSQEGSHPLNPPLTNNVATLAALAGPEGALLSTAVVRVRDVYGHYVAARFLIDPGSQLTMISQTLVDKLQIPTVKCNVAVAGFDSSVTKAKGKTEVYIRSRFDHHFELTVAAVVMSKLPLIRRPQDLDRDMILKFDELQLADPEWFRSHPIDGILCAGVFFDTLIDRAHVVNGKPGALETRLGYLVMGRVPGEVPPQQPICLSIFSEDIPLETMLRKFWKEQEVPNRILNPDDVFCDKLFDEQVKFENGKYVVPLPFRPEANPLGNNRAFAKQNFLRLENRLRQDPTAYEKYVETMQGYVSAGIMERAQYPASYIIPQNVVIKDSSSTALRTVVNASARTKTSGSLNDILFQGPNLLQDLPHVLMYFRLHKVVVSTDVQKMYLQIKVKEPDRQVQRIFWRASPDVPIEEWVLTTVSFGVNASPYLALKTVSKMRNDHEGFPLAKESIDNGTFMDNICGGGKDESEARECLMQLIELFKKGGFKLRKFSSSSKNVLDSLPQEDMDAPMTFPGEEAYKILGLVWLASKDQFTFAIRPFQENGSMSRRSLLSFVARIFDPLGFLAPFTFSLKLLMQKTYVTGGSWDDELPEELAQEFGYVTQKIDMLSNLNVPRYVPLKEAREIQILMYSDASQKGMATAMYVRCVVNGEASVSLVASRTRVAPLRGKKIPQLELGAAALAVGLFNDFNPVRKVFPPHDVWFFTDSQIVLDWLDKPPHTLPTFVANKVVEILNATDRSMWLHVVSARNCADVSSRGQSAEELVENDAWFNGHPDLLLSGKSWFPATIKPPHREENDEPVAVVLTAEKVEPPNDLYQFCQKFSDLRKLQRCMAWILRFAKKEKPRSKTLSVEEMETALLMIVRLSQENAFKKEMENLKENSQVQVSSSLVKLTPFFDDGLLRVGGRLDNSNLPTDAKHPLIVPKKSHLAHLIARFYHEMAGHGGPLATLALLQQRFWIVSARTLLRQVSRTCTLCARHRAKPKQPIMGPLPKERVTPSRAFAYTSVDTAGPFYVKEGKRRGAPSSKAYLLVFTCFSSRACHLEMASALTTEASLAAFDRFCARRGYPTKMFSDSGTNFKGAARNLKEVAEYLELHKDELFSALASRSVTWCWSPVYTPSWNGVCEIMVRLAKQVLKKLVGDTPMFFEEYCTVFSRVEQILNSRPLTALASSPDDDLCYLSPAHLISGHGLLCPPEQPLDLDASYQCRWKRVRQLTQAFWKKWSQLYLHQQITRKKWTRATANVKEGQVVLVSDQRCAPTQWAMGRIVKLHPGKDGVVRVVTLRTQAGNLTRAVKGLVEVPTDPLEDQV